MATDRQGTQEDTSRTRNKVLVDPQHHTSFPILGWIFGYQKEWLQWDLTAGLITAAVVIPKAMAYATIAGLPVQVGLYTVFVPMTIAIPALKPINTGSEMKLAMKPNRRSEANKRMAPTRRVSVAEALIKDA